MYSQTLGWWTTLELGGFWLVLVGAGILFWGPRGRLAGGIVLAVALVAVAVGGSALGWRLRTEQVAPAAVVIADDVEARFAPLDDATVHFTLGAGRRVRVREDRDRWWLVERADGQQGWIRAEQAARIGLP